jgi:hypothetical protein
VPVETGCHQEVLGDPKRIEAEILGPAGERLHHRRLVDVEVRSCEGRQEDAESHRTSNVSNVGESDGLSRRGIISSARSGDDRRCDGDNDAHPCSVRLACTRTDCPLRSLPRTRKCRSVLRLTSARERSGRMFGARSGDGAGGIREPGSSSRDGGR